MSKVRPILKWLGGKYRILDIIKETLPKGKRLVEPFLGSAAVFLNTDYQSYLLNDANSDLINLYTQLKLNKQEFIEYCEQYFSGKFNDEEKYYSLRVEFNSLASNEKKAALFLYLNRHGYNGLCRYNRGKGEFNVPFGRYKHPYFPEKEMLYFLEKLTRSKVKFVSQDFKKVLATLKPGDVVYADPPYVPLSDTAKFTQYCPIDFTLCDQQYLADSALKLQDQNIATLISNHNNEVTKKLYSEASQVQYFDVSRSVSCNIKNRAKAKELLALFRV